MTDRHHLPFPTLIEVNRAVPLRSTRSHLHHHYPRVSLARISALLSYHHCRPRTRFLQATTSPRHLPTRLIDRLLDRRLLRQTCPIPPRSRLLDHLRVTAIRRRKQRDLSRLPDERRFAQSRPCLRHERGSAEVGTPKDGGGSAIKVRLARRGS